MIAYLKPSQKFSFWMISSISCRVLFGYRDFFFVGGLLSPMFPFCTYEFLYVTRKCYSFIYSRKTSLLTNLSNRKLQAYGCQSTSVCRKLWEMETGKLEVKNIYKLASLEVCVAWRLTVQILESSSLDLTPVSGYSLLDHRQITYLYQFPHQQNGSLSLIKLLWGLNE